ncbi:MAG TPA: YceI family protein [Pseudacidobacterium sp.]|jgi:polyisoprenoid-binding protein YceI|nr:YceI family protein [Pseudacidobacterium sp.]
MHQPLRRIALCAAFLISASLAWSQAAAPQVVIHLDPQKTEIRWTLHDVLHTVEGTFQLKSGMMRFNPQTGAAEGEFLVDVATGESGNKLRDAKMQDEVLESRKYPEAFFHPIKVSGTIKPGTTQNATVEGTFNIHGNDHPLSLQLTIQLNGTDATATTHFVIPYVAWGMKDPSKIMLRVDKEVSVDVTARGTVEGAR